MANAQQKALWPYTNVENIGQNNEQFRKLIQQDKERYLEAVLKTKLDTLQIPLITAESPKNEEEKKATKRSKKNKNAFMTFLKKCLYFKPKTFLGTHLIITILSTVIGIWTTSILSAPKHTHYRHYLTKGKEAATNQVESIQTAKVLNTFYTVYQSTLEQLLAQQNSAGKVQQILTCPDCKTSIQVESAPFSDINALCLGCQKNLQPTNNLPQVQASLIRQ